MFIYSTLQCLHLLVLGLCQQVLIYSTLQCLYLLGLWYDHRFHLLYFAMFTFVGCVVMLKGFYILYLATFILVGSVIWSQVSFTLPCNVYICWFWNMFTSFHLLYLAMFTSTGFNLLYLAMFIFLQVFMLKGFFTLPCNVYICWVCNMFTDVHLLYLAMFMICRVCNMFTRFHLLYLAMFTFVGSVICLQVFIYSTLQCLHLLGL